MSEKSGSEFIFRAGRQRRPNRLFRLTFLLFFVLLFAYFLYNLLN